jgi:hypothetical protein
MEKEKEQRLEKVMNFLGYGDPKTAKVWFIGIEEAKAFDDTSKIDKLNSKFDTYNGCKGAKTSVYQIISKIILGLKKQEWFEEWRIYRDNILFSKGSEAVQLNLFPLGKQNIKKWEENYTKWFNLKFKQYYDFVRDENNGRFKLIKNEIQKTKPLTICFFSKRDREQFIKLFNLLEKETSEYDNFFLYKKEKIIFTPFFGYQGRTGFSKERINNLIQFINDNHLNPF